MLMSLVVHSSNCCVNNRRWITIKATYLFTGSSDKMQFQAVKNDNMVVSCADCRLRPQWRQIEEEDVGRSLSYQL